MVNNFLNINKANNDPWPQLIEHTNNRPKAMKLEIKLMAWDRHKHVGMLNRLMWKISTLP